MRRFQRVFESRAPFKNGAGGGGGGGGGVDDRDATWRVRGRSK